MAKVKAEKTAESTASVRGRDYWLDYREQAKMAKDSDKEAYANAHLVILNIEAKWAVGDSLQ